MASIKKIVAKDNFNKFLRFAITLMLNTAIVHNKTSRQLFILI